MKKKITLRTLTIKKCKDCPKCIFDEQEEYKHWGKYWCHLIDRIVAPNSIPEICPLPMKNIEEENGNNR